MGIYEDYLLGILVESDSQIPADVKESEDYKIVVILDKGYLIIRTDSEISHGHHDYISNRTVVHRSSKVVKDDNGKPTLKLKVTGTTPFNAESWSALQSISDNIGTKITYWNRCFTSYDFNTTYKQVWPE